MSTSNQSRKVVKPDGTIMYLWEGKLHNWSGPSIIHPDKKEEYYLHGIKLSEKDYKSRLKEQEGLPFFKKSGFSVR